MRMRILRSGRYRRAVRCTQQPAMTLPVRPRLLPTLDNITLKQPLVARKAPGQLTLQL